MSYLASVARPAPAVGPGAAAAQGEPFRELHSAVEVAPAAPLDSTEARAASTADESSARPAPERPRSTSGEPERRPSKTGTSAFDAQVEALVAPVDPTARAANNRPQPPTKPATKLLPDAIEVRSNEPAPTSLARVVATQAAHVQASLAPPAAAASALPVRRATMAIDAEVNDASVAPADAVSAPRPSSSARPASPALLGPSKVVARAALDEPAPRVGAARHSLAAAPQVHIGAIAITVKAAPAPAPRPAPTPPAVAPVGTAPASANASRAREGFAFSASRHYLRWS